MKGFSLARKIRARRRPLNLNGERSIPAPVRQFTLLSIAILVGAVVLVSCGFFDSEPEPTPTARPSPVSAVPSPVPPQVPVEVVADIPPCHSEVALQQGIAPAAEPTPEIIRIQLLERPYRMIPQDIVLRQNRWYQFVITAGEEWHAFTVHGLGDRLSYEIPPGGEKAHLVHTTNAGVFVVENWRRLPESPLRNTITVIPQGVTIETWHEACGFLTVYAPAADSSLSAPLVIQGEVKSPSHSWLDVARVEAWNRGQRVGVATREHMESKIDHKLFYMTIPYLPQGDHTLLLKAFLQNDTLAATATMPLTVLPDPPLAATPQGFRGFIDHPADGELLGLPLTVQGWVVIPDSIGTGVGTVEVWDGPRDDGKLLAEAVFGINRQDVAEALGDPRYASSGFIARLAALPAGPIDLHIYIRDRVTGQYVSQPPLVRRVSIAEGKVADADWPVALAAAPDGRLFYAELQTGNIRIIQHGQVLPQPFATLENVSIHRDAGVLGLALHPDFPAEPFVYAMYVVKDTDTGLPSGQRVVRFRDDDNSGADYTVILGDLPATTNVIHNGGRIAFGPDGKLYVTIGDTDVPDYAQDPARLEGSILRYNPDGTIPDDNPFPGSPVYAYGLRNVFGLAFQPNTGALFATDNGPGGFDEVNLIEPGQNYGWPEYMGSNGVEGFVDPIAVYGMWPEPAIGPTGAAFSPDRPDLLLFCGYNGFYLRALPVRGAETSKDDTMVLSTNCALDVTYSSDGWVFYSTISAIYRARLDDLLRLQESTAQ